MPRLPPLTTLPVLEAAARLKSFSAAAEELHVTHGAVSHQIKSLEEFLGVKLFARSGRGVALTTEGESLAATVRDALGTIAGAVETLKPAARENTLTISVLPSFASRWLMPRIGKFLEAHPAMQISIEASQARANFRTDGVDVGIRFGVAPWPDVHATRLAGDEYIAVASPRYRNGRLPRRPEQLKELTLFRDEPGQWKRWFAQAGIDYEPPVYAVDYNDSAMFLQKAVSGEGIALTRRSIAAADISAGRVVQLFDIVLGTDKAYYLVCLPHAVNWPKVAAFREWLICEIDWN